MIVGTAGHIDHGKTALVKALTGVDADRLAEEKARGITIDLGYAYLPLPGGEVLGFVDVPGHERFIHNMLAGATGIDHVLMVVAADDGPMPQTREHLAILELLGLERGVVAITKIDRVDADRRREVLDEVRAMLAASRCAGFAVKAVSSVTGEGVAELRGALEDAAATLAPRRRAGGHFRLAIDRAFTLQGIGTVVTGTVFAGRVAAGDRLFLSPPGIEVRVRGLHAQNRAAEAGGIGQRCALNIAAPQLERRDIERGQWLLAPALHAPTTRIDARLGLLSTENRALRHGSPVHLHLGAKHATGRVALLEGESLEPGKSALAQLVVDEPIGALHGDRFVLRDPSAQRTIGGGGVIDGAAPERGRRKPQRLAVLRALEAATPAEALGRLLDDQPEGIELDGFARQHNLLDAELAALLEAEPRHLPEAIAGGGDTPRRAFGAGHWAHAIEALLEALAAHHLHEPDSAGAGVDALRRALPGRPPAAMAAALLQSLVRAGRVSRIGSRFRLPGHAVGLDAREEVLWQRARPLLVAAALAPPQVPELAAKLGVGAAVLRDLFRKLARMGRLHPVRREVFLLPPLLAALAEAAEQLALADPKGAVTVGPFRERTGLHRNLGIPVLEYFDRAGFTLRRSDGRRVRRPSAEVFGDDAEASEAAGALPAAA